MLKRRDMFIRFFACLPSVYYLSSQYDTTHNRIIFVLKFWGPYLLLVHFLNREALIDNRLPLLLVLPLVYTIYDYFRYENDTVSVRFEKTPEKRTWNYDPPRNLFVSVKLITLFVMNTAFFLLFPSVMPHLATLQAAIIITFGLHNRLHEKLRFITYFILYCIKGLVFGIFVFDHLAPGQRTLYLAFCIVYSFTYLPRYMCLKLFDDLTQTKLKAGLNKLLIVQPIVFKNVFLLGMASWYRPVLWILIFIDILTVLEYYLDRRRGAETA